jgi:uncharacterized protein with gpF-like domain
MPSLEDRVRKILVERGLLTRTLHPDELVFHFTYAAERWIQMTDPDVVLERPYLRYVSGGSPDAGPGHLEKHGLILPATDSFWTIWYPLNGIDCKCTVMSISESLLRRRGWTVSENRDFKFPVPDPGFAFNIGKLLQERYEKN